MQIQESFYLNLIRKTYLFNRINVINYGLSLNLDNFNESFSGNTDQPFDNENRQENVTGAFLEYSNTEGKTEYYFRIKKQIITIKKHIFSLD